jgi:hypothetical protein
MLKKAVALVTAVVFALVSTSCMTWGTKEIRTTADHPRPGKRVLSAVKRSGEVIEFSRAAPARIVGNEVIGTPTSLGERDVEIEGPFPLIKRLADGTVTEVTDAKGRVWSVRKVLNEEPNKMIVRIADPMTGAVAIPLSEIWQVKIMKTNTALTILAALGTAGVVLLALASYYINRD